jgi:hypothetical protein
VEERMLMLCVREETVNKVKNVNSKLDRV